MPYGRTVNVIDEAAWLVFTTMFHETDDLPFGTVGALVQKPYDADF